MPSGKRRKFKEGQQVTRYDGTWTISRPLLPGEFGWNPNEYIYILKRLADGFLTHTRANESELTLK